MTTTTIRVSTATRDLVHDLAQQAGVPMQEIVERALEQYRRHQILAETNAAYAALRSDPQAVQEWQAEQDAWDDTLGDGLEDA